MFGIQHADDPPGMGNRDRQLRQPGVVIKDIAAVLPRVGDALDVTGFRNVTDNAIPQGNGDFVVNLPGHRIFRTVGRHLPQGYTVIGEQVDNTVLKAQLRDRGLGDVPDNIVQGAQPGLAQGKLVQYVEIASSGDLAGGRQIPVRGICHRA